MHEQEAELALELFARTFSLKAEKLRRDAARIQAEALSADVFGDDRAKYAKAVKLFEEAQHWDATAVKALDGYLLVYPDNQEFQTDPNYRSLIDLCCGAGRCLYVEPCQENSLAKARQGRWSRALKIGARKSGSTTIRRETW